MKKIKRYLFSLSIIVACTGFTMCGCKKNNAPNTLPADTVQLLTGKPWKLLSYGYDYNKNGLIDKEEENIRDCQKDNDYLFNPDGTGVVMENMMSCGNNKESSKFSWNLTNNKTTLDFIFGAAYISSITRSRMVLTSTNPGAVQLVTVYSH